MLHSLVLLLENVFYFPVLNLISFIIWLVPGHNAAWGIIFLTLIVRFILIIPSKRSAQSQKKMMEIQPLIQELRQEYGDDQAGFATAQMELFRKNKINPLAGCGPMLIQLPFLYAITYSIYHGLTTGNPNLYHWLPEVGTINTVFLGLDLLKPDHTFIMPILAAVLQFFSMRMVMKPTPGGTPDPSMAAQNQMMYLFPIITLFISYKLPAGVSLYWIVTTAFSIVQQYYVNREHQRLQGVVKSLDEAEKKHPEHRKEAEEAKKELKELEKPTIKNGVSVTVRRKK